MIKLIKGDGVGGEGLHFIPKIHKNTMIFLHGLGDTAQGWAKFIENFKYQQNAVFQQTKYILLTAPHRPITFRGGFAMPAWADILGFKKGTPEDEKGYKESLQRVRNIVENEVKLGIDTRKILIGGFSQGGAMSYLALEELGVPLAGLIVLSGWLPFAFSRQQRFKNLSKEVFSTPILHCHGTDDPIVLYKSGLGSVEILKKEGFSNIDMQSYSGIGHSLSNEEALYITSFIENKLTAAESQS